MNQDDTNTPQETPPEGVSPEASSESMSNGEEVKQDNNTAEQEAPSDALNLTPDKLSEEEAAAQPQKATADPTPKQKKPSKLVRFFKKINVFLLLFILLLIIAGVVTIVYYFNSQKITPKAGVSSQQLTPDALQKLSNTDASVGSASQTLTIQGNAIINGQTLMRNNLNVAGELQTSGSIKTPDITVAGTASLGSAQINNLQVASNTAIQGSTSVRDLSVSGSASFNGAVTASQLTTTRLILSGNASLEVPNHIGFTGPTPSRSLNGGALGGGGSASIAGSDTTGTVNINTGNGPAAGCFVRINFNQRFTNQPHVLISPVGAAAGQTRYYADRDQAGFSICTATAAPSNQSFAFDYFVTN